MLPFISALDPYKSYLHRPSVPEHPTLPLVGQYETALWLGAGVYTYSLDLPQGTNGLAPEVTLTYNSQLANQRPDILGAGWTINNNYITRNTNNSFSDNTDDSYVLTFNGQTYPLIYNAGEVRYHTQVESFLYIKLFGTGGNNTNRAYWIMKDKDGTTYRFGYQNNSELQSNIYNYIVRWSVDRVTDTHNNSIVYTYRENPNTKDLGAVYLDKITYNNDKSRIIEFVLESSNRPDSRYVYEDGNKVRYSRRISDVYVKANGFVVRRYALNYTVLDYTSKSFISSIALLSPRNLSLPPVQFEYYSPTPGWNIDDRYTLPSSSMNFELSEGGDAGVRLVDLNRDGLVDMTKGRQFGYLETWLSKGTGWIQNNSWNSPIEFVNNVGGDRGVRFVDVNGDGYQDIVYANGASRATYLNTGTGWSADTPSWYLPQGAEFVNTSANIFERGVRLADANGDGLVDIFSATDDWTYAWINNGTGWEQTGTWKVPLSMHFVLYPSGADKGVRMEDVNGDNLPDLVKNIEFGGQFTIATWINNGAGWINDSTWKSPVTFVFAYGEDSGARFFDLNGDNLQDIVVAGSTSRSWVNNGTNWIQDNVWNVPPNADFITWSDGGQQASNNLVRLADLNGDGIVDIIRGSEVYPRAYISDVSKPYLIKTITNNVGGSTTIDYTQSTKFDNRGTDSISDLGFSLWLVSKIIENNGMSSSHALNAITHYTYKGGYFDYRSGEFRGFSRVDEIKPLISIIKHFFHQDIALKGKELRVETYNNESKPFQIQRTTWTSTLQNGYYLALPVNETIELYDGSYDPPKSTSTKYAYDQYGNIVSQISLGINSTNKDDRYEIWEYVYNTTDWILNNPKRYALYDFDNATKVRETLYRYDNLSYGATPIDGDLTWEEKWLNGGTNMTTKYTYDSYGHIKTEIDPNNNVTTYTYGLRDFTFTFIDRMTNEKGQATNYQHLLSNGGMFWQVDSSGYTINYTYDVWGRLKKEIHTYDSVTYPTKEYGYHFDGTAPEDITITQREEAGVNHTFNSYFFYDGLGNLIQLKTGSMDDLTDFVVTNLYYDDNNRPIKQSNPYFEDQDKQYSDFQTTPDTTYVYDALSRVIRMTNADGTNKTTVYDHGKITAYDENSNKKIFYTNAYDQISAVIEYLATNYFTTKYAYNAAGELIQIKDSYGNIVNYTYDTLGRKIQESSPDLGTWKYTYGAKGNLIKQTDNRGINVSLRYDVLSRLTSKTTAEGTTNYTYDQINGTLSKIATPIATYEYGYDARLRKINETMKMDGKTFVKKWSYDSLNRIVIETMPDGTTINYTYNHQNQIATLGPIIANAYYTPLNKPDELTYQNGLVTDYTYNTSSYRLSKLKTSSYEITYKYDKVGNILWINDSSTRFIENITYDKLDRVISSNKTYAGQGSILIAYTYDFLGNMLSRLGGQNMTYYYGATPRHAPKKITFQASPSTPPQVSFVNPTPSNGSSPHGTSIYINVSSSDSNTHYTLVDANKNLMLWMRMDDLNATGGLLDLSEYGRNGTKKGNALQTLSGKFGKAFSFDGSGDGIEVFTAATTKQDNFTLSTWVKWAGTTGNNEIISYNGNSSTTGFGLRLDNAEGDQYELILGGVGYVETAGTLTAGTWTHLVAVRSSGNWTIYKDTISTPIVSGGTLSPDVTPSTDKFWVGINGQGTASFNGYIDEVIVFNYPLTLAEIKSLYNATASQYARNFTGLGYITHTYKAYSVDTTGAKNQTEKRYITLSI